MARSADTDPLLAHQFALLDVPVSGAIPNAFGFKRQGVQGFVGCKSVTLPSMSVATREIKEGNWPFVHHVSTGVTTTSEAVISFAVFPDNIDMWLWLQQAIWGRQVPRRSLMVVQFFADKQVVQRKTLLEHCIPTEWKPATDLDAMSSEIVMEELTLSVHRVITLPLSTL